MASVALSRAELFSTAFVARPETLRLLVTRAARHALAFRAGKETVYALAKRASEDWEEVAMVAAFSRESLSIAADNYEESLSLVRRIVRN